MLINRFVFVFLLFTFALQAQEPIRYTTKGGLPSNHVYDIAQDEDGFIWFATNRGIAKYDGETFKTFTIKDGLPNNDIWGLISGENNRLYFFSKSKQQGYIQNDSIHTFSTIDNNVISPKNYYYSTDSTHYWMVSTGFYSLQEGQLIPLKFNDLIIGKKEYYKLLNNLSSRYQGYNNDLWNITDPTSQELMVKINNFIYFFNDKLEEIKAIEVNSPFYNQAYKKRIGQGIIGKGQYFFLFPKGVFFVDFYTKKTKHILFRDLLYFSDNQRITHNLINDQLHIYIANSILKFSKEGELIEHLTYESNWNKDGCFVDRASNIWLNNLGGGSYFIPIQQRQAKYFFEHQNVQRINLIHDKIWVGVGSKGFYQYQQDVDSFILQHPISLISENIYQIAPIDERIYFIASEESFHISPTSPPQLFEFDAVYNQRNIKTNIKEFKFILETNQDLFCLYSSGIIKHDKNKNETRGILFKRGILYATLFDNDIYFGGTDGLGILKNENGTFSEQKTLLSNTSITSIENTGKSLITGTDGRGVFFYHGKNNVQHLRSTDGLSVQKTIKKGDYLWLATQEGVKKIKLDLNHLSNSTIVDEFYQSDGLLEDNTNDILLQDSFLYVASDIGLTRLNLNSKFYKNQPKIYFHNTQDTIVFKEQARNNITIAFGAIDYVNQDHLIYQYRLLPQDTNWTTIRSKELNFSNLSPDLYTLEVKATDQHKNQSTQIKYIAIIPLWWETTWAKVVFGILFFALLVITILFISKTIRKREIRRAQEDKRIASLELLALRSQMNPHFVHNSLNAIQYYVQRNEVELSENYLAKFSKLIRLFFEYSRRKAITIEEELRLLHYYLQIEQLRFEEKLNYNISIDHKIDTNVVMIPSMLLQPIVENAVNHGIFHKAEKGTVNIHFKHIDDNTFKIIIRDDGIGWKKAKRIYKRSAKNYKSNSSNVLDERLSLLNKSRDWHINYDIEDRSDISINKTGTIVTLTFKELN